jgi:hypothetical protein
MVELVLYFVLVGALVAGLLVYMDDTNTDDYLP